MGIESFESVLNMLVTIQWVEDEGKVPQQVPEMVNKEKYETIP
jgi:hypothetical protein